MGSRDRNKMKTGLKALVHWIKATTSDYLWLLWEASGAAAWLGRLTWLTRAFPNTGFRRNSGFGPGLKRDCPAEPLVRRCVKSAGGRGGAVQTTTAWS